MIAASGTAKGVRVVVIVVALAIVAGLRIYRHRKIRLAGARANATDRISEAMTSGDAGGNGPKASLKPGQKASPREWPWSNNYMAIVAGREIRERLRAKSFRVVTVVILAVVAAAIVIPILTKSNAKTYKVGYVGPIGQQSQSVLRQATRATGTKAKLVQIADDRTANSQLRSGSIDLAVESGGELVTKQAITPSDTSAAARLARQIALEIGITKAFRLAELTPAQIVAISGAKSAPIVGLVPAPKVNETARATALIGIILIFVMLNQYNTWTLIGVMEEKSSRVVEVLLSAVKPIQLLGGKVIGIGTVALTQAASILIFALILGKAVGSTILQSTAPLVLVGALVWLVVGYAFYCWVYAAAGSLAERQDQVQTLALPLSIPVVAAYILAIAAASSGHASPFVVVLAYFPPTAPFAMPVLVGIGQATWWELLISVAISLGSTVFVARLAAAIYRRAVLRTGGRVSIRQVLRAEES